MWVKLFLSLNETIWYQYMIPRTNLKGIPGDVKNVSLHLATAMWL